MHRLGIVWLGLMMLLPLGCGKEAEDKPANNETAAESKTPAKNTPEQQDNSQQQASNSQQQASNAGKEIKFPGSPTNPTTTPGPQTKNQSNNIPQPGSNQPAGPDKAFARIPQGTIAMLSIRPSTILASQLVKSLPKEIELDEKLADIQTNLGFGPNHIARVTVALWPGDGHVFPGLNELVSPQPPGPPGQLEEGAARETAPAQVVQVNAQRPENGQPQPGGPGGPGGFGDGVVELIKQMLPKFDGAIYIHFQDPVTLDQLKAAIPPLAQLQPAMVEGVSVQVHPQIPMAGGAAIWQPEPGTLVITFKDDVADIINSKGQGELVKEAVAEGANSSALLQLSLKPLQPLLTMGAQMTGGQVPDGDKLAQQLKSLSLFVDLNAGADVKLLIGTTDPEAVQTLKQGFDQQYQALADEVKNVPLEPGTSAEVQASVQKLSQEVYDSIKAEAQGNQFRLSLRVPGRVVQVGEQIAAEQRRLMRGKNNLKQIGLAHHIYHERYSGFPFPAGKPSLREAQFNKLSWRVHLLPILDEGELYEQFKLEEAWDSEHNKALLEKMPDIYKLNEETKLGHTQIVAPAGTGFIVDGDKTRMIRDFRDGTSNTIMVLTVKPDKAVPWTKPGGFDFDPAKAAEVLGGDPKGFLALFADGAVKALDTQLDAETLKALLTISGGEVIDRSLIFGNEVPVDFGDFDAPEEVRPPAKAQPE